MLKPSRMKKVEIIGLKKYKEDIITKIQHLNVLHIKTSNISETNENPSIIIHKVLSNLEKIHEIKQLLKLKQNMLKTLIGTKHKQIELDGYTDSAFTHKSELFINNIHKKTKDIIKSKTEITKFEENIKNEINLLTYFKSIHTDQFQKQDTSQIIKGFGIVKVRDLREIKKHIVIKITRMDEDNIYIAFNALKSNWDKYKTKIKIIKTTYNVMPLVAIEYLKQDLLDIDNKKIENKNLIETIRKKEDMILAIEERWQNIKTRIRSERHMGCTDKTFIIEGWAPQDKINQIHKIPNIVLSIQDTEDTETPIKLEHNKLIKPFEKLTQWFALPKYNDIDPTLFIAIAFPLFFGIIVADIAYGIIILLLSTALFMKTSKDTIKDISKIIMTSSIIAIFFGILFGSFFGNLLSFKSLFNAMKNPIQIMIFSLLLGFIHTNMGLVLGVISSFKNKNYPRLIDSISWLCLEIGLIIYILTKTSTIPIIYTYISLTLITITILNQTRKGISGIIEIPGFIASWISYIRLMALTVATAWLAFVVNLVAISLSDISIVLASIPFIIGHAFITITNLISAFVHSLRLNYVEFFNRFYEGGGKEYKPLKLNNKYHKINGENNGCS
ncbi:MAG: V-type ATP synthase subunit I [DPANN group archaeon]|nr:V-type ATP synthase subunit I [DPANN group archaeon]